VLLTLLDAATIILPLLYLLVAVAYALAFFSGPSGVARLASPGLRATIVVHLAYFACLSAAWKEFPAATTSQATSMLALSVALVYAFVEWHGRERATGFWMVTLVFFFQLVASVLNRPAPPDRAIFHDPFFAAHVSLALLGYAAFVVAAAYAFLFLQLYRDLKGGRFSTFYGKLPPLAALERMMLGALVVGFISLSAAVALGAIWAERLYGSGWLHDPKILFTLATWVLYGAALLLRRFRRWQGRQTAFASLAGLAAIVFSLLAVNLVFSRFHDFL
jgi:ABC-type uncharacterized transport system permease subunit